MNMKEIISQLRQAGKKNIRIVQQQEECTIEVNNGSSWSPVLSGIKKDLAEDIVQQSVGNVLLG